MGSSEKFVVEGSMEFGPKEDFFIFIDGDYLGTLLRKHFGALAEAGYTPLGRMRVTVELVEGPATAAQPPDPRA